MVEFFSDNNNWKQFALLLDDYMNKKNTFQGYYITGRHAIGKSYRANLICRQYSENYDIINIGTSTFLKDKDEEFNVESYLNSLIFTNSIQNILRSKRKAKIFIFDELECVSSITFIRLLKAYNYIKGLIGTSSFTNLRHICIFIGDLMVTKIDKKNVDKIYHFKMCSPLFEEAKNYLTDELKILKKTISPSAIDLLCKLHYKDIYQLNLHLKYFISIPAKYITLEIVTKYLGSLQTKNEELHLYDTVVNFFDPVKHITNLHSLSNEQTINLLLNMLSENYVNIFLKNNNLKNFDKTLILNMISNVSSHLTFFDFALKHSLNKEENDLLPEITASILLYSLSQASQKLSIKDIPTSSLVYPCIINRKSLRTIQRSNFQKIAVTTTCYNPELIMMMKDKIYKFILEDDFEGLELYLKESKVGKDPHLIIQLLRLDKVNVISTSNINKIKNKLKIMDIYGDE